LTFPLIIRSSPFIKKSRFLLITSSLVAKKAKGGLLKLFWQLAVAGRELQLFDLQAEKTSKLSLPTAKMLKHGSDSIRGNGRKPQ